MCPNWANRPKSHYTKLCIYTGNEKPIKDLDEPITITMRGIPKEKLKKCKCYYHNKEKNQLEMVETVTDGDDVKCKTKHLSQYVVLSGKCLPFLQYM